jgi:hypothetical protein
MLPKVLLEDPFLNLEAAWAEDLAKRMLEHALRSSSETVQVETPTCWWH